MKTKPGLMVAVFLLAISGSTYGQTASGQAFTDAQLAQFKARGCVLDTTTKVTCPDDKKTVPQRPATTRRQSTPQTPTMPPQTLVIPEVSPRLTDLLDRMTRVIERPQASQAPIVIREEKKKSPASQNNGKMEALLERGNTFSERTAVATEKTATLMNGAVGKLGEANWYHRANVGLNVANVWANWKTANNTGRLVEESVKMAVEVRNVTEAVRIGTEAVRGIKLPNVNVTTTVDTDVTATGGAGGQGGAGGTGNGGEGGTGNGGNVNHTQPVKPPTPSPKPEPPKPPKPGHNDKDDHGKDDRDGNHKGK